MEDTKFPRFVLWDLRKLGQTESGNVLCLSYCPLKTLVGRLWLVSVTVNSPRSSLVVSHKIDKRIQIYQVISLVDISFADFSKNLKFNFKMRENKQTVKEKRWKEIRKKDRITFL